MRLLLTLLLLTGLSANAQPLWRNFFTTNQNPRVTVVAGSNATVQASTVGFDQRIFTVNAVPGAGTGQTNNTIVIAGTNGVVVVTNSSGGITTYTVHNTNIAGISQTNWPLSSITNANYLTNWALIPTNFVPAESSHATNADYATEAGHSTNTDFVLTATLTNKMYASNVVSGGQVPIGVLSPTAGANGWFLIQSNGVSEWSLNGAYLTNVPFTFWTNYTSNPNDSTNLNGLAFGSGLYGMTSYWSYATAPGVGPIGIWYSGIDTNTVISTNGGSFYGAILDLSGSATAPGSNQLVTASWVRNLFSASGSAYYNSTNIDSGATNADMANQYVYKYQSTIPISDSRVYSTTDFLTNSGYVGAVVTTNRFSYLSGAILVNSYFAYTGGSASPTLLIKPEIYISSDGTNWYSEVAASPQSITHGTTNLFQWLVDFPATSATNATGFLLQRRFKITGITGSGTRTLRVFIGTNAVSGVSDAAHLTMQSPTATAGNAYLANNQVFTGSNFFAQPIVGRVSADLTGSTNYFFSTNTVATLPAAQTGPSIRWCSDVITSSGVGAYVRWDWNTSTWRTWEGVSATADVRQFILNGWASALNVQTPISTIYFSRNPLSATSIGFPASSTAVGGAAVTTILPSVTGNSYAYTLGSGTAGGIYSISTPVVLVDGEKYGTYRRVLLAESDAANAAWSIIGMSVATAQTNYPTDGAYFLYDRYNTNSHSITGAGTNNWIACTGGSSSYTYVDTGLTPSGTTAQRLGIILTTTNCVFYTNGVACVTNTTTLPTANLYLLGDKHVRVHGTGAKSLYIATPATHLRGATNQIYP